MHATKFSNVSVLFNYVLMLHLFNYVKYAVALPCLPKILDWSFKNRMDNREGEGIGRYSTGRVSRSRISGSGKNEKETTERCQGLES